jgi:hypothetical protein
MVEQVVHLEVGEPKIRLFERKRPIAAVAVVWNGLDANLRRASARFFS